ncbi:MAG: hypothetical protein LCH78_19110 [Proteobacteria bacterium]|nr:hypothetical protein [Pseudomonadota bacterium]
MSAPMTEAAKPPPHMTGCACEQGSARFTQFDTKPLGCDETEGRFADVTLNRCRACHRLWLRYLVEYEGSPQGLYARTRFEERTMNMGYAAR